MITRKIRRSQIVSPFGPGAIIDLVGESFVAEDAGNWRGRPEHIHFPRLACYLKVTQLRTPGVDEQLPYFRFPQWLFCPRCRRMRKWSTKDEREELPPACSTCSGRHLAPMRFVAVCGNGHLRDVNWHGWAHSQVGRDRKKTQCKRDDQLFFNSRSDAGSGLGSLEVVCDTCGARRSLEGITNVGALSRARTSCDGRQPWQTTSQRSTCDEQPRAVQRGASNVYFPDVVSAIDIPPDSQFSQDDPVVRKLRRRQDFRWLMADPEHGMRDQMIDYIAEHTRLDAETVESVLDGEIANANAWGEESPSDIAPGEWNAFCAPSIQHDPRDKFITRRSSPPDLDSATDAVSDVVLVDKLREVRVLTGFKRYTRRESVPSNLEEGADFLPAVEVFGEGFFLRLSENALSSWECRAEVRDRCTAIAGRVEDAEVEWVPAPTPRFLLLHTFAHMLLRHTAFEAGYATSALRERLYTTPGSGAPKMAGVLIYTAAGDAEGTLGGLVRMGEPDRLSRLLCGSLASAQWCSFDPVCGESDAQGPDGLSRAACHACSLVPETSCVAGNRLLDRRLVVDPEFGFFAQLMTEIGAVPGGGIW